MIAPILAFTSEEIWQHMPANDALNGKSVFLNDMPAPIALTLPEGFAAKWDLIFGVRSDVQKALELKRNAKEIGKSLEAKVQLICSDELFAALSPLTEALPDLLIVSQVEVLAGGGGEFTGETEGLSVTVLRAEGEKCERCWKHSPSVGTDAEHPTLCARCAAAIR